MRLADVERRAVPPRHPPPPGRSSLLDVKFPVIPSSTWRGTVQTKRNLPAFENTTL